MASRQRLRPRDSPAVVLLLFVGSGAAALIYEVVWFQLIELVIGATAASLRYPAGDIYGWPLRRQPAVSRLIPVVCIRCVYTPMLELGIGACRILIVLGFGLSHGYVPDIGQGFAGFWCAAFFAPSSAAAPRRC